MIDRRQGSGEFTGLRRERFVLRRSFVAECTGEKSSDGIDDEDGGKLAAAEDEIPDGKFVGDEMLCNALVHTFVAAADQNESILLRQSTRGLLRETFSSGREQNDRSFFAQRISLCGISNRVAKQGFHRLKKRF